MIRLCHLYPDLLNLYGEYANLTVLARALTQCGQEVEICHVDPGDPIDLSGVDLVYAGAGTESRIELARRALEPYAEIFRKAAAAGLPMLFTGSAAELTAKTLTGLDGAEQPCLGITDCRAVRTDGRELGDVLYRSDLSENLLAGFLNKSGYLTDVAAPLFTAEFGPGGIRGSDGKELPAEGIRQGNVFATYALGPILARNPWLKRKLAAIILERAIGSGDVSAIADDWSDKGYAITVRELQKREEK